MKYIIDISEDIRVAIFMGLNNKENKDENKM